MMKSLPGCDGRWCWFWHSLFLRPAGWRQEGKASQIKSYRIIFSEPSCFTGLRRGGLKHRRARHQAGGRQQGGRGDQGELVETR